MGGDRFRALLVALSLTLPPAAAANDESPAAIGSSSAIAMASPSRVQLRSAVEALNRKDLKQTEAAVTAALDDPSFSALDDDTRHFALALATRVTLQLEEPAKAQGFAIRATQMAQQSLDDWRNRLSASMKLQDARDQAECIAAIARRWGEDANAFPAGSVLTVFANTAQVEVDDVRIDMLDALYERRWRPKDWGTASPLWRELSRLLLAGGEIDRAAQVAVLIDESDDIIAMRADWRFRPIAKSQFVRFNAKRTARDRIKALQESVRKNPRSLEVLTRLLARMASARMDLEAIALAEEVDRRLQAAGAGPAPYDNLPDDYPWVLNARAIALRHLGRFEEAVVQLRRAVEVPGSRDKISYPVNLAWLLCDLDRPDEALMVLPQGKAASPYGNMAIESLRLAVAVEKGNTEDVNEALDYLRAHRADSPSAFQGALVRTGRLDEARQWLISRLNDSEERTRALLEMQRYFEPKRTKREAQWHENIVALKADPAVLSAISKLGQIDAYTWRYSPYD
jgi:tetratricopeptide (TPR) repeat protein